MPIPFVDEARELAEQALSTGDLRSHAAALDAAAVDQQAAFELLARVTEAPDSLHSLRTLRSRLGVDDPPGAFERVLLLRAWLTSLSRLPELPLAEPVKRLMSDEVRLVAAPPQATAHRFNLERSTFVAFSKLATLRRFAAGQLHWEVAGLPRSWLIKVQRRSLPRLAYTVFAKMRGFAPAFFIHLNANRKDRAALLERESNRSYFRMAQCVALQPEIKGLIASSWLHSPDTMAVSPHLVALNRVFLENGALVTTMGPADPESGVFTRSPERRRLFEQGVFTPTTGLILWPRAQMLAWAAAHPELSD